MGDHQQPGPMCGFSQDTAVDAGTNVRRQSPPPGPMCGAELDDEWVLRQALAELEAEAGNFALRFIDMANIRQRYLHSVRAASQEILRAVRAGEMTPRAGAELANALRNEIMETLRKASLELGRAAAEQMKLYGKTLEVLLQEKAALLFKKDFTLLTAAQQDAVYLAVIESSGKARPSVVRKAAMLGKVGRACLVLTLGIALYNVATAEDKALAVAREGATVGGGLIGGMAGGAAAGLVCGPGAPVCVTIGVFVGGALGALGADVGFDWMWR